ncbi:MAG: hypothetical protein H6741_31720 [Alphaproteobacteria bacterium]|nr:hypothetical protein [Alphaproteobacteria bacterium]
MSDDRPFAEEALRQRAAALLDLSEALELAAEAHHRAVYAEGPLRQAFTAGGLSQLATLGQRLGEAQLGELERLAQAEAPAAKAG